MIRSPFTTYLIVTGNYWGFTLTDGALRMLVALRFISWAMARSKWPCCLAV